MSASQVTPNIPAIPTAAMPIISRRLKRTTRRGVALSAKVSGSILPAAGVSPAITVPSGTWDADKTFPAAHLPFGEHRRD